MSRIKEIWCMPHSHLDIGYTHPQPMLMELQTDYLDQALDLCDRTADYPDGARFCWTVEANAVLRKWLETADSKKTERLRDAVRRGQFCVTALPFHTTPCANANEMVHMLSGLDELSAAVGDRIRIAINHDVNGQPWTIGQFLLDSGIDFYLTGINIHMGGIPMPRPAPFLWEMSDGRKLQCFVGEHYSLFSQFLFTEEHSVKRMHEGAKEYADRLEKQGYRLDFAFLTATNPPLYDNNCPDAELSDLIRRYNAEGHEFRLRLVTADDLRKRIRKIPEAEMPVMGGDWTDYWNFGAGSTARETRVSRLGKNALQQSEVIDCFTMRRDAHRQKTLETCYNSSLVFEEHTWGASQSVSQPDSPESYSQLIHKIKKAYETADLAGYLLGSSMETLAKNPHQSNALGSVIAVNTSAAPQTVELKVPKSYLEPGRQLAALRIKSCAPYLEQETETCSAGLISLLPFQEKRIPLSDLRPDVPGDGGILVDRDTIKTPYYQIRFHPDTGGIIQITDIRSRREILDPSKGMALFEPIRETIDETINPANRRALFPRDVDLGNRNISQWNHDWAGKRTRAHRTRGEVIAGKYDVTIVSYMTLEGMERLEQRITFYTYRSSIRMTVRLIKQPVYEPESLYFAVPLQMKEGWECSYDTAGMPVKLDKQQLGTVCRDWITVDTGVSVYDDTYCVTLNCPDAPLVQIGDFGFGRESRRIERKKNPLLLEWALNNYWDTNFCANQSGFMMLTYELNPHDTFLPRTAMLDGLSANCPVVIGAGVEACEEERRLLSADGNSVVLHVYPEKESRAIRLLVSNPTDKADTLRISLQDRVILEAAQISPTGEVLAPCLLKDGAAIASVPAGGVRLLRLTANT